MARKQYITLRICGKDYPFTIDAEKEELYRIAAQQVNSTVTDYANLIRQEDYTAKDYLALIAFKFARECLAMSRNREVGDEDVKAIDEISDKISEYMNRLDPK